MQVEDSRTPGLFVERLARRLTCVDASATRFDEISPLWQKIKSLAILKGLFIMWQYLEPTLTIIFCYWPNFHSYKWPNTEKKLSSSGHTCYCAVDLNPGLPAKAI